MSRQQKIIPPVKGNFTDIINAVSDGKGTKQLKGKPRPKNIEANPPKKLAR
jgi:hypothetical protein